MSISVSSLFGAAMVLAPLLSACGLFNRDGPATPSGEVHPGSSASILDEASSTVIEYPSNLVRTSGEVLHLRLSALFPRATSPSASTYLDPAAFNDLTAEELDRTIADENRPASAIAQVGLRNWAAPLCADFLDAPGAGPARSLFSTESIMTGSETLPEDDAQRTVVAAARNGWLDLYTATSPEVVELLSLYNSVLNRDGGSAELARQSVCMAVLLAPQFLLGNTGKHDPIRRAALELGRKLPEFQEMADYEAGTLSIADYVSQIQEDPVLSLGYREAVKSWHEAWWGLREFRTLSHLAKSRETSDPRGESIGLHQQGWSEIGHVLLIPKTKMNDGHSSVVPSGRYTGDNASEAALGCTAKTAAGDANLEDFDPRTRMVVLEHINKTANRWEVVGGWVLDDSAALAEYEGLVKTYDSTFRTATACSAIEAVTLTDYPAAAPRYKRCKGRVTAASSPKTFIETQIADFNLKATSTYVSTPEKILPDLSDVEKDRAGIASTTTYTNALSQSVHANFTKDDRRVRRLSPSGWQDGVSRIKLWWSGDYAYVCNSFARYRTSCTFRPSNGTLGNAYFKATTKEGWYFASDMGPTPLMEVMQTGAYTSLMYGVAPTVLNQYRCGIPNEAGFPAGAAEAFNEDATYPRGYSFTLQEYLSALPPSDGTILNDHATLGQLSITGSTSTTTGISPGEVAAIARLQQDLWEEPRRLIDHVFDQKLPYSDLVTAPYTLGRAELELAYRSQLLNLPLYPPGYTLPAFDDPSREAVRIISRPTFPAIPLSWVRGPYAEGGGGIYDYSKVITGQNGTGLIPPAPSSGILTMPAFLGPVSGKMRTVASRIFDRLLCADANFFVPQGDQIALHESFMSHPSNPAPAEHMDSKSSCYSCHANLDPLAAALSGNFLEWVQRDELRAKHGQFSRVWHSTTNTEFLGGRSSGDVGDGAFLGMPAKGFEDVGEILAASPQFYRCTVSRAFEKILGRVPLLQDAAGFERISQDFMAHRDFDRMIRDIAGSNSFQREN